MHKSKRIVFINQDSGYLMIDIINKFAQAGYKCVLITGRLVERDKKINNDVLIERIIRYRRTTTFKRLFSWGIGSLQSILKILFRYRGDFLFITSNPPLAPLLPLVLKNSYSLLIFDIYPDVLSELGFLPDDSMIIKWWQKYNRKTFAKASAIFTLTDGMRQVVQKYSEDNLVKVVPVWTDNSFLKPVCPTENPFLKKHNITGKFVVLYSGNIGLSSNVEVLLDAANGIERDDIVFLIIGEGAKKKLIKKKIKELKLKNVLLLPWQPAAELPFSLSSASLAVISLGYGVSKLAIPSKLYNFLSVGAPLLCLASQGSEVESLVSKKLCGKCFEPSDITGLTKFIIEVADDKETHRVMKNNALQASKDFDSSNVINYLSIDIK